MSESILDRIVARKYLEIEAMPEMQIVSPCAQDFDRIFTPGPGLIAEIKAASPSEGNIVDSFDPVSIAQDYISGGATALSILTDSEFFKGSYDILNTVRALTDKPLLCKDFILSDRQIRFARHHGADMVLLIVKILDPDSLRSLKKTIDDLGMRAVIEIQNEDELQAALLVDPEILLINNRNLTSFSVDLETTNSLLTRIPDSIRVVAASGIRKPEDLENFGPRVDGFLIGTALMRSDDKADFLRRCCALKN
jgi:indole-3-glycerol phosphate synthase